VHELRAAIEAALVATGSGKECVQALTRNASAFHKWYADPLNEMAVQLLGRGGAVNVLIMRAAKECFAGMYQAGGRLFTGTTCELSVAAGFCDIEVPGGVVRDVMRCLYSHPTERWLRQHEKGKAGPSRDISRGFRSQVAGDASGRLNLYSGTTVVQMQKTLTFMLNCSGNLAMEDRLVRRAFFVAMVTVTRHKKYQADARLSTTSSARTAR